MCRVARSAERKCRDVRACARVHRDGTEHASRQAAAFHSDCGRCEDVAHSPASPATKPPGD
eukprot:7379055-Prymnesium_polylepis.1